MTPKRYETAILFDPELPEDARKEFLGKLSAIIAGYKGEVLKIDDWGNRKLAYPIRKKSNAFYTFLLYTGNRGVVEEVERNIKIFEGILRHLTTLHTATLAAEGRGGRAPRGRRTRGLRDARTRNAPDARAAGGSLTGGEGRYRWSPSTVSSSPATSCGIPRRAFSLPGMAVTSFSIAVNSTLQGESQRGQGRGLLLRHLGVREDGRELRRVPFQGAARAGRGAPAAAKLGDRRREEEQDRGRGEQRPIPRGPRGASAETSAPSAPAPDSQDDDIPF